MRRRMSRRREREGEKTNAKKAVGNAFKPDISPAEYKEHMWKKNIFAHAHSDALMGKHELSCVCFLLC